MMRALWVLSCILAISGLCQGLKCKDEAGTDIDWFLVYKLPRDPGSPDPAFQEGSAYFFMTPGSKGWERSKKLIHQADSILGLSVRDLYGNRTDLGYVLYNDQPPDRPPVLYNGHTKGILMTEANGGLWLPHSVPHFPNFHGPSYGYPPGGLENGQMFFCLSLDLSTLDRVGGALQYTKPDLFKVQLPEALWPLLPELTQVALKNVTKKVGPWYTTIPMATAQGLNLTVFVKGPKFRKEIYGDWIAPKLGTSLDVQSWLNGAHPIGSKCSAVSVYNVLTKSIQGQRFTTQNDHSKWAVGGDVVGKPWACVGDLNRMKPQKSRGGLVLCLSHGGIWSAMKDSVRDLQPCGGQGLGQGRNHHQG